MLAHLAACFEHVQEVRPQALALSVAEETRGFGPADGPQEQCRVETRTFKHIGSAKKLGRRAEDRYFEKIAGLRDLAQIRFQIEAAGALVPVRKHIADSGYFEPFLQRDDDCSLTREKPAITAWSLPKLSFRNSVEFGVQARGRFPKFFAKAAATLAGRYHEIPCQYAPGRVEQRPEAVAVPRYSPAMSAEPDAWFLFYYRSDSQWRKFSASEVFSCSRENAHIRDETRDTDAEDDMQRRQFGPSKREVAIIGQGTWNLERANRSSAVAALRRGLDLGMNHIDTAEMYGAGAAEELIAEAIAGRRDEVFLISKVLPENASRSGTVAACERTLARLQTDRLDCYLLHWRGRHKLVDTIAAFEELQRIGKILSWGVSNFDIADLEEAVAIAGEGRIACNQVLYHLQQRAAEHEVIPWCEAHQVAVTAYSPFGSGHFPAPASKGGGVLAEIADTHNATPRQVALAFLTRQKSVFAIPKASSPAHAEENAGAGELHLLEADLARIDQAFPRGSRGRGLQML